GYGDAKPVGELLDLHVVGTIAGTRYAVELQDDDGRWSDVTAGDGYVQNAPDEAATIPYALPRGLTATPKKLRLRNISDSATETVWLAVPSADGEPAPRDPQFVPPPVGDALDGTATSGGHPTEAVQRVATGIAVGSVAFVGIALAGGALRRRRNGGVGDG
ncbi:MAG: hypothetical protein GX596_03265, partial [Propionibacterium sp.]|nr:hypothetical protein [Propionibacterium sp.]